MNRYDLKATNVGPRAKASPRVTPGDALRCPYCGEDRLVDMIHGFDAPCEAAGKLLEHLAHGLRFVAGQRRDDVAVMVVSSTSIPRSTPTSTSQATEQT